MPPAASCSPARPSCASCAEAQRSTPANLPCGSEQARLAAYAAAAWADERLQTCGWEHAGQWEAHLLQRRHFQIVDAGEGFFRYLGQLGPDHREAREVFALALLLGMRGRHALDPADADRRRLLEQVTQQLLPASPAVGASLLVGQAAAQTRRAQASPPRWRAHGGAWALAGAAALACVALYAAYAWQLHRALHAWIAGA